MTASPLLPAAPCTANPVLGWQERWAQIAATFAQAMLAKHGQVRLALHWMHTLICLPISRAAAGATERASGMGGSHLEDNCVVNPWGWPLALLSALCLSWLLSQCLHPSACLKEELLKFIAALTHQLETCQAAYSFTTIFWALTPEGA